MDLIDDQDTLGNAPEFTVSELSGAIKRVIEGEFGLVRLRGEVGRVSLPRSGHVYLDLKDESAVISGVIWKGKAAALAIRPEEGMEVVATGRLTTFPGQSKYQIVIDDLRPAGQGALMAMLEKRKAALAAAGLFAEERKRAIPYLPEVIGVVTSPSGAVIRDILHRLSDRFPRHVLIWPVAVQGEKCAPEVAAAIKGFNALAPGGPIPRPDLLIVARGGGSVEDLWGFNEEIVVRAAAASEIPLISAVGHETDTTLIDLAADRRAPTPTAAAEMAVPVRADLLAWVTEQEARLARAAARAMGERGQRLRDLARALPRAEALLTVPRQRLDLWGTRLPTALDTRTQKARLRLAKAALRPETLARLLAEERRRLTDRARRLSPALARAAREQGKSFRALVPRFGRAARAQTELWRKKLDALDRLRRTLGYEATLERGYAVVRAGGQVVTTKAEAEAAAALQIQFRDGRLSVGPPMPRRGAKKAAKPPPGQGDLF